MGGVEKGDGRVGRGSEEVAREEREMVVVVVWKIG